MEIIESITEAYSMQPTTLSIATQSQYEARKGMNGANRLVKVISHEVANELNVYVGYNFTGQKLFQYQANSVNIHYLQP